MDTWISIISSVGFPIACCLIMFARETKVMEKMNQILTEVKTTVDNNTNLVTTLIKKLGGKG